MAHQNGACSSDGRAPDCGSGGQRFKTAHAPHGTLAQSVERQTEDLRVSGSIPEGPTIIALLPACDYFFAGSYVVIGIS